MELQSKVFPTSILGTKENDFVERWPKWEVRGVV